MSFTLTVEKGNFAYPHGERQILKDVEFALNGGQSLAVLGPNGAGKTTLLRCITGLLRWNSGASYINGTNIAKLSPRALWQNIAYVPQARGAAGSMSVENLIMLGRSGRIGVFSTPAKADYMAVDRVIERLKLSELRHRRADELSGGELQLALIGRGLAAEPGLIILDEPESNLDFKNRLTVLNTVASLKQEGIAAIFNTHYPEHALRYAEIALMLDKKGNCTFGKAQSVITEQAIAKAFSVKSRISSIKDGESEYNTIIPIEVITENRQ